MNERNPFGGKNPHGMYVPMSEDEIEVLYRLAEAGEFKVVIKGDTPDGQSVEWGYVNGFKVGKYMGPETYYGQSLVTIGDKRITFFFRMNFTAPAIPQPNYFFDMEVWALGHLFFSQRFPTEVGGNPIQVVAGMYHDFALDVAVDQIDPRIVKQVKPKAIGLTSRQGNMRLDREHQNLLVKTQQGEKTVREMSEQEARAATDKMKKATGR